MESKISWFLHHYYHSSYTVSANQSIINLFMYQTLIQALLFYLQISLHISYPVRFTLLHALFRRTNARVSCFRVKMQDTHHEFDQRSIGHPYFSCSTVSHENGLTFESLWQKQEHKNSLSPHFLQLSFDQRKSEKHISGMESMKNSFWMQVLVVSSQKTNKLRRLQWELTSGQSWHPRLASTVCDETYHKTGESVAWSQHDYHEKIRVRKKMSKWQNRIENDINNKIRYDCLQK
jgi:hypothetical protein